MIDPNWARGIDISYANARTPNLKGRDFAFVRATYGPSRDRRWGQHARNVVRAGVILGAYAFGIYGNGREQARAFLDLAGEADLLALDLEKESGKPRMTAAQARAFVAEVQSTGRRCGLYHSDSSFPALGQDWAWVARWGPIPPDRPWTIWQYRGSPLDLDVFHGDRSALEAFAIHGDRSALEAFARGEKMIRARGALAMSGGSARFLAAARVLSATPLLDSPGGRQVAMARPGYVYPYIGAALGSTRAVLVNTPKPYPDGLPGPTVLYVAAAAVEIEDAPGGAFGAAHTVQLLVDGKPAGEPIILGGR